MFTIVAAWAACLSAELSSRVNETNHRGWVIVPWLSTLPWFLLLERRKSGPCRYAGRRSVQVSDASVPRKCGKGPRGDRPNVSCISLGSKICNPENGVVWSLSEGGRIGSMKIDRSIAQFTIYPFFFSSLLLCLLRSFLAAHSRTLPHEFLFFSFFLLFN